MIVAVVITVAVMVVIAILWFSIHHWTHRALRAEAAVERIINELELHRILIENEKLP